MELSLSLGFRSGKAGCWFPRGTLRGPGHAELTCTIGNGTGWMGYRDSSLGCQRQRGYAEISNLQAQECQTNLPAPGEGKPAERGLALQKSCLHSTATVETWTVTGSQVGLCHVPGCQCQRVTTLDNQIRHQHTWSQSPSAMIPIKSLAQKYHPGRRERREILGLSLNLI